MRKTVAFLLAGGMGSRLNILGWMRAKPAVPFGGSYRIIDFTLTNAMRSGISIIGILTQYRPYSLMQHIANGEAWDMIGRKRAIKILPPSTGINDNDWYRGTADAVRQNLSFAERYDAGQIVILSGDHIYNMNYAPMIEFHQKQGAALTIAMMRVPWEETNQFGLAILDDDNRIVEWQEKPKDAKTNLASMGVYVVDYQFLKSALEKSSGHDFGKNIIPEALKTRDVYAYLFDGYWADVGTLRAYWKSNMDVLRPDSGLELNAWKVRTNMEEEGLVGDRPPLKISRSAKVRNALVSCGCYIEGKVINSILSPGVRVEKGASVVDSVIMHDSLIEKNASLFEVIADKRTVFGAGCSLGNGTVERPNEKFPDHLYSGLTIVGKKAAVPASVSLLRNTLIEPRVMADSFEDIRFRCGSYIAKVD